MSVIGAINSAISGIQAAQIGLSTSAQNIANVNTVGYSRQAIGQVSRVIEGVGAGVRVTDITRTVDRFLTREVRLQSSDFGEASVVDEFYRQMQNLFGAPGQDSSIAADLAKYDAAIEALASAPDNAALRFDVVASGEALARTVNKLANDVQSLRKEADRQIGAAVGIINVQLDELVLLNTQISRAKAGNQSVPELEDQLNRAVQKITEQLDVNVIDRGDGTVELFTTSGIALLDGLGRAMRYPTATTVEETTVFGALTSARLDSDGQVVGTPAQLVSSGASSAVTTSLISVRIKGLVDIRDSALVDLGDQIESLSDTLRDQINAVHNQGSGFPAPNILTGTRTVAGADAFQTTGDIRISVVGATGLIVDTVDIDLTATGATTVNGLINTINTALSGNAVAQVTNGNLVITANNSVNGLAINDIGSAESVTAFGVSHFFGLNDFFLGARARDFAVRSDISSDPSRVSTAQLSTTANIGSAGITIGDNRTAQAMAAIDDTQFTFAAVGGLPNSVATLGEFTGAMIGLNSVRAADAQQINDRAEILLDSTTNLLASQTGVNLDEEMSNLILFQNAFEMSARILDIANEMFKTLIEIL